MEERINSGRQNELDFAKGLAILFMIAVHCLETFANGKTIDENPYGIITEFFGSFTSATVFMILLGVGIIYSRKAKPLHLVKRGTALIAVGYILNLVRGFIPMLLSWKISGSDEWIPYLMIEPLYVDILQFAGLTFIFFGLAKKMRFKPITYVLALIVFEIMNLLLSNYGFYFDDIMDYQNPKFYLAAVTGLLWGTSELSSFPFLSWIFYPIAGYLFGDYLIKQDETGKKRLYVFVVSASTVIFTALIFLCWYFEIDYGWETDASFYHHLILGNFVFGSCAFLFIGIVFFLSRYILNSIQKILSRWSNNITEIYFIQWVLIGWIAVVTDYNQFEVLKTIAITLAVLMVSDWLAMLVRKSKIRY